MGLPTGTVGAIAELLASADLLRRGYEAFRSVSPSCSCDLAILKDGQLLRVEVRSGYIGPSGGLVFPKTGSGRQDMFAVVVRGTVYYIPQLP